GRLEDLDRLLQLPVLAPKLTDLPGRLAGHPGRLALVYLGLADPLAQRLRRHPQPFGYRGDRCVLRRVITSVLAHQTDRLGLRLLVVLDRHERDILPNLGSMHETRDGSSGATFKALGASRHSRIFGREDVDSAPALLPWFWIGLGVGSVAWVPAWPPNRLT